MPFSEISTLKGDHVWSKYNLECDAKIVAAFVGEVMNGDETSKMQLDHVHDDIASCNYVVYIKVSDEAPIRVLTWGDIKPKGIHIRCHPENEPDMFRLHKETPSFDLTEDDFRDGELCAPIGSEELIKLGECSVNGNVKLVYLEGEKLDKPITRFNESYQIKIQR